MDSRTTKDYSQALGKEFESISLIQENKYCLIYLGKTCSAQYIIKQYRGADLALISSEAQALVFYHDLANNNNNLIDSGLPFLNADKNLLLIGFVEGISFNEFLYKAWKDRELQSRSEHYMNLLGQLIRNIRERTQQPGEETDPFIFEYFEHSSKRLEQIPILGSICFKGYYQQALEIMKRFKSAKIVPSFCHGDFVFKNIHVHEQKVGLIDFANSIFLSHPLNDIYNMRMALNNMLLPGVFKARLLDAFGQGLGDLEFEDVAHEFYSEYERRRWLMLKLATSNPKDLIQGLVGLTTFARRASHGAHSK